MPSRSPTDIRTAARKLSAAEHPGTIGSYYPFWDAMYRPFLVKAVEALPEERFDYKPLPEMFTAHQVILHIAECERGWIHHTVEGGTYEEWIVPHRDPAQGWETVHEARTRETVLAALEEWHAHTQRLFALPASELTRVCTDRSRDGSERRFTLHWILDTLQQHEIHHRAQLILYLRLMGMEPPPSM